MCHVESIKKCDLSIFLNFPLRFETKLIFGLADRQFYQYLYILCLVNWTYVNRWIEQKMWFYRYFWIFLYVSKLNYFLVSQISLIFRKFFILSIMCLINESKKTVILSIFLNFPVSFDLKRPDSYVSLYSFI